eukprot:scaffold1954_cov268-Pinguiococcus_pyrenoidosus.AAC.163
MKAFCRAQGSRCTYLADRFPRLGTLSVDKLCERVLPKGRVEALRCPKQPQLLAVPRDIFRRERHVLQAAQWRNGATTPTPGEQSGRVFMVDNTLAVCAPSFEGHARALPAPPVALFLEVKPREALEEP